MMRGEVTAYREAIVELAVAGPTGARANVRAIVDTGFTEFLSLPRALIESLELPHLRTDEVVLADSARARTDVYECVVVWDGRERVVRAYCLEGAPLLGMGLLHEHLLTIEVVEAGAVAVHPLG